jgi:hypothetical protein
MVVRHKAPYLISTAGLTTRSTVALPAVCTA